MTPVGQSFAYQPRNPVKDIYGKPLMDGPRVNTVAKSKEFQVIYATNHSDPSLKSIYEEFKMSDNKPLWLSENKERLQKFDINVAELIQRWK